jgi:hypothetical protein
MLRCLRKRTIRKLIYESIFYRLTLDTDVFHAVTFILKCEVIPAHNSHCFCVKYFMPSMEKFIMKLSRSQPLLFHSIISNFWVPAVLKLYSHKNYRYGLFL